MEEEDLFCICPEKRFSHELTYGATHESNLVENVSQVLNEHLSRVMRKPTFCICENKDADQVRGNREADQRLCFRFLDSTIHLLYKSKISSR